MKDLNLTDIRACVFDAYGTLFDVNSAAQKCKGMLCDNWEELAGIWRTKQLQYTWLRSLMGRHVDFWQLTGEALDFALDSLRLRDAQLRDLLMGLYLQLSAYPEVKNTLVRLKTIIASLNAPSCRTARQRCYPRPSRMLGLRTFSILSCRPKK